MSGGRRTAPIFLSTAYTRSPFPMSSSSSLSAAMGYVCDTIPPARLIRAPCSRSPSPALPPTPPVTAFRAPITDNASQTVDSKSGGSEYLTVHESRIAPPPGRKLCVRHQRMADEGTNLKLQQVRTLPLESFSSPPFLRMTCIHGDRRPPQAYLITRQQGR